MLPRLLALVGLVSVAAIGRAGTREDIEARYRTWDRAYLAHDMAEMRSVLAPRFRLVTGSGRAVSRKAYLESLRKAKPPQTYRTRLLRVTGGGGTATAWTEETSATKGAKPHVHLYRDRWVRLNGAWRLLESKTLEEK